MAKLLKEVWKTFFGSFFETEEEAARAEIHWKTDAAITAAWKAAMVPIEKDDDRRIAEFKARYTYSGRDISGPAREAPYYNIPPTFQAEFLKALEKEGVMAEPKLSTVTHAA